MNQDFVIGNYRVTHQIGEGGMGAVYAAQHTVLGRQAAIKLLLPEHLGDQKLATRFINEARAAAAIRHPGIVEIFDFGQHQGGGLFIAMELLQGEDLEQRKQRGVPIPTQQAILFILQTLGVLDAAHRIGITHRDLKPSNIFVVPDPQVPGGERIKLLDFGIAKFAVAGEGGVAMTRAGAIMGTPTYMPPEQCLDSSKVDHRSDIYAAGCILYELLCGRPPFVSANVVDIMTMQIHDQPAPPSSLNPGLAPGLDAVVLKALAKDRDHRYQSAGEFAHALQAAAGDVGLGADWLDASLGVSAPGTAPYPGDGARRSSARWVIPLTALLVVGLGLGGFMFLKKQESGDSDEKSAGTDTAEDPNPTPDKPAEPTEPKFTQLDKNQAVTEASADTATWLIRSDPPGAEVRYLDKPVGHTATPLMGQVAREPVRPIRVTLRKSGYEDFSLDLTTGEDFDDTVKLAASVEIGLFTKPEGAQVYKADDNSYQGNTPVALTFVEGGEYEIIVRLDGYKDQKLTILFDKPHKESIKLEKLALVSVHIESEPEGAEVWLGDTKLGTTPYTDQLEKQSDKRTFVIKHEGCKDGEVRVRGNRDDAARVELACEE